MSAPVARVACRDTSAKATLERSLGRAGVSVGRDVDERHDLAVYLDDSHHMAGPIVDIAAERWIAEAEDPLLEAMAFFRGFASTLGHGPGVAVVITSTAGTIGFAGCSLATAVSAGLNGLVLSIVQEVPGLTGVLLVRGSPATDIPAHGPDLPVAAHVRSEVSREDVIRWASTEISRIALDPAMRRPGALITISHEPLA
jgi:hypothetical protein